MVFFTDPKVASPPNSWFLYNRGLELITNTTPTPNAAENLTIEISEDVSLGPAFGLLSQLWLFEVDKAMVHRLRDQPVKEAFESLGGSLPPDDHGSTLERLAIDFCQLLIGPKGQVSPVQSIWQDARFQSQSSVSMHQYFELLPGYDPPNMIVDHLGVQLDFVSKLLAKRGAVEAAQEILGQFVHQHLTWTDPFLDSIRAQAQTDFYRGLANITRNLISIVNSND